MTAFFRRLAHVLRRRRAERELADELEFHRQMMRDELAGSPARTPTTPGPRRGSRACGRTSGTASRACAAALAWSW